MLIESCCTSLEAAQSARARGAGRIELCEDLSVGGVTPSESLASAVIGALAPLPVNVLVRPRGGDFVFSADEVQQMLDGIDMCKRLGAAGVVIGALTPEGDVDMDVMRTLIDRARPLSVTFHRAFDVCRDPLSAFADVLALGCDRLLTSGHESSAYVGRPLIAELVRLAAGRIIIMPGCGVRPDNIDEIEADTNAVEFHGTALP